MDEYAKRRVRFCQWLGFPWMALVFLFMALGHSTTAGVIAIAGFFLIGYVAGTCYPLFHKTYRVLGDMSGEDWVDKVVGWAVIFILLATLFCGLAQDRYSAYQHVYDPYRAVKAGDRQTLQTLLEGFDVDTQGYNLNTPLHAAARRGRIETINWLIQRGADVNARNYDGETPLAQAAQWKQEEAARLLRKHGAKILGAPGDSP